MKPLTLRQFDILNTINGYLQTHGHAPSFRRLMHMLQLRSPATIAKHIAAIRQKGFEVKMDGHLIKDRLNSRQSVNEALRWQIWRRDNYTCLRCGSRECLTVDHVDPAGVDLPDNLQTLCRTCNTRKRRETQDFRQ